MQAREPRARTFGGRTLAVFPADTARYLCDRRIARFRHTRQRYIQFLLLLQSDELVWVFQDTIRQHVVHSGEDHWIINMRLVTRWAITGRRLPFLPWTRQQRYNLFHDRFVDA
jgi:hypothetical protein